MATGTITNQIKDPSGTVLAAVPVVARLRPGPGFRADNTEVSGLVSTVTDGSGNWSLALEQNANITPSNSYWEVEEQIPDANGGRRTWAALATAGSHTLNASLTSPLSSTSNPTALTTALGDARYLQVGRVGAVWATDDGAIGDGVADDRAALVAADVAAAAAGKALAFAPGTYLLGSSYRFTAPVLAFAPGAMLKVPTGVVATINGCVGGVGAFATRIFALAGTGAVVFSTPVSGGSNQSTVYAEWFGAVGDGATDDFLAVQAALDSISRGKLKLLGKSYALSTFAEITRSSVGVDGAGAWSSFLVSKVADKDVLRVTGTAGSYLTGNELTNFSLSRLVTPTTGKGMVLTYTAYTKAAEVVSAESATGFNLKNTSSPNFDHCTFSRSLGASGTAYGWYLDGSGANLSATLDHCVAIMPTFTGAGGTGYGCYVNGPVTSDTFLINFETASCSHGIFINATSTTVGNNQDIHIVKPVNDLFTTSAITVTGAAGSGMVCIEGGWSYPSDQGAARDSIFISGTNNVTVQGGIVNGGDNFAHQTGVNINGCLGVKVLGVTFRNCQQAVLATNSSMCNLEANSTYNETGKAAVNAFSLVNSSRNNVSGNSIDGESAGTVATGVRLDNSSDYCNVIGNVTNPGAVTTVESRGTATHNYFAGVVT